MLIIEKIKEAHSKVKSGEDFPAYIREIKLLGVAKYVTMVHDSHTEYADKDGHHIQSSPMFDVITIAPVGDKEKFCNYLKMHQQGKTSYPEFRNHCAETGIEKWVADLNDMTCTYYDMQGNEMLVEKIPQ